MLQSIREFIYKNITNKLKEDRMDIFFKYMDLKKGDRILDVGASSGWMWKYFFKGSIEDYYLVGLDLMNTKDTIYKEFFVGDARKLDFEDGSFDVVFSNSVLEHVGDLEQQKLMLKEMDRVGKKFFLQVPNKNFFIEPHYFIPFLQYLPINIRRFITKTFFNEDEIIYLPSYTDLKMIIPEGCIILREKFLGMTKSFFVVKQ